MICEWNELVECVAYLPFMVVMNRESYSRMDQNGKTGLLFADGGNNIYIIFQHIRCITVYRCIEKLILLPYRKVLGTVS